MKKLIAVIGVGYVGLQCALAFAKNGLRVIAFDTNKERIKDLASGVDTNHEAKIIAAETVLYTSDPKKLIRANYYLIAVPTPLNERKVPNLQSLKYAAKLVGSVLKKGDVVVLESTVFPGATRELLLPILEEQSGLIHGLNFFLGYSSERINPGDEGHTLLTTTKVISGTNAQALKKIKALYRCIPDLRVHCAPSLEVAESSKLLENIQRNVNIALMNEFAQIMSDLNVSIYDVLEASKTKWNFLPFAPGLVGGHCIPEDPYYLTYQADKYDSKHHLITCACDTNQQFYHFIVNKVIKLLIKQGLVLREARIAVLGMSFKANVSDTRHSLSINVYHCLKSLGMNVIACDPLVNKKHSDLNWESLEELEKCHALILCQAHKEFIDLGPKKLSQKLISEGVFVDIPGAFFHRADFDDGIFYWSL